MTKEPVVFSEQDDPNLFMFWCPGCKCGHWFRTPPWTFNGDMIKPTVRGSILVGKEKPPRCHLFIESGKIRFLNDCDHNLKGQTIPMEPFP